MGQKNLYRTNFANIQQIVTYCISVSGATLTVMKQTTRETMHYWFKTHADYFNERFYEVNNDDLASIVTKLRAVCAS